MSQKKKKCAYRYTFSRPEKKDDNTRVDYKKTRRLDDEGISTILAVHDRATLRPKLQLCNILPDLIIEDSIGVV